jgi:hypothetical protein
MRKNILLLLVAASASSLVASQASAKGNLGENYVNWGFYHEYVSSTDQHNWGPDMTVNVKLIKNSIIGVDAFASGSVSVNGNDTNTRILLGGKTYLSNLGIVRPFVSVNALADNYDGWLYGGEANVGVEVEVINNLVLTASVGDGDYTDSDTLSHRIYAFEADYWFSNTFGVGSSFTYFDFSGEGTGQDHQLSFFVRFSE